VRVVGEVSLGMSSHQLNSGRSHEFISFCIELVDLVEYINRCYIFIILYFVKLY